MVHNHIEGKEIDRRYPKHEIFNTGKSSPFDFPGIDLDTCGQRKKEEEQGVDVG